MNLQDFIAVTDFCNNYSISQALVIEFKEYGLIEIIEQRKDWYLPISELPKAEKIVRLHSELGINLEGLSVVIQLLDRITAQQEEITFLKNRLDLYE